MAVENTGIHDRLTNHFSHATIRAGDLRSSEHHLTVIIADQRGGQYRGGAEELQELLGCGVGNKTPILGHGGGGRVVGDEGHLYPQRINAHEFAHDGSQSRIRAMHDQPHALAHGMRIRLRDAEMGDIGLCRDLGQARGGAAEEASGEGIQELEIGAAGKGGEFYRAGLFILRARAGHIERATSGGARQVDDHASILTLARTAFPRAAAAHAVE